MQNDLPEKHLVLASTSPYRKELLRRLGLAFDTQAPDVDETRRNGESPEQLVRRLAEAKARAVAKHYAKALVIGSDQVAVLGAEVLGKPGTRENAVRQLRQTSGQRIRFLTGLCVVDCTRGTSEVDVVPFDVAFRALTSAQIDGYIEREAPFNCAGSFKSEGLGIALFDALEGTDPTALMGLPLIRLVRMLQNHGLDVLQPTQSCERSG